MLSLYASKLHYDECDRIRHVSIDQHFFIEQQRQIRLARQAILTFQCQNTKYGCQETLKAEERVDHEKYCDYQKVHCAEIDCKTDISFLNLLGKFF